MPARTVALFLLVTITVLVVPGPSVVFVVTSTLRQGRTAGLRAVAGLETGLVVHVMAAALGLSALVASSPAALTLLKVGGAAYLAVLGLARLRDVGLAGRTPEPGGIPEPSNLFWAGFLVDVLNPKTVLFFVALFPQFVDPSRGAVWAQSLVLGGVVVVLGTLCDSAYAVGADLVRGRGSRRGRRRPSRLVASMPGAALIGLAAATALT